MFVFAYFHLHENGVPCRRNIGNIKSLFLKVEIYIFPGVGRLHMIIVDPIADFQTYFIDELDHGTIMLFLQRVC